MMKTFEALNVSSKFAICGLPIRVDSYKTCSFQCAYCFANNRKIMEFDKSNIQIANLKSVENRLDNIFNKYILKTGNFLDKLIRDGITWHCGGMSDPFQPVENDLHITEKLIKITNKYNIHILFSTKSDTVYYADIQPDLHTFQLSVSNVYDRRDIEPNIPSITERKEFFRLLKQEGFRVGIRIQPFIPDISTLEIVKEFEGADNFTLEGIKLVPQNKEHKEYLLETLKLKKEDFTQMGLLNLKPDIRLKLYKPFIEYFEASSIPYSIADNDLHYLGTNKCCCGDKLIRKSTSFNNTTMLKNYGKDYTLENVQEELGSWFCDCKANHLFTSNRQEGCRTVIEFYEKRFDRKSSPFSPKFQYYKKGE